MFVLSVLFIFSSALALPRNHVLDLLPWPAREVDSLVDPTPAVITKNVGKSEIKYCIAENTLLWPRARTTNADVVYYLTQRLRLYLDVMFVQVENGPECDLTYHFRPFLDSTRFVGLYVPDENAIYVTTKGLSIFESVKVTLHETFHALGLGHNDAAPSIMTTGLRDVSQLMFPSDLNGLYLLWQWAPREFGGLPGRQLDYYERLALSDMLEKTK